MSPVIADGLVRHQLLPLLSFIGLPHGNLLLADSGEEHGS